LLTAGASRRPFPIATVVYCRCRSMVLRHKESLL
jgi:hypothetical protein